MIKLTTGFGEYSADGLAHLGETVSTNLPTIAIFATLKPTPPQISDGSGAVRAALAKIGPGRAQAIDASFSVLALLLAEVSVNAPQIENVTDTQLATIGIPVMKKPTRITSPPAACQVFTLRHSSLPGEVLGRCKPPDANIRIYESQWTLDPNGTDWNEGGTFPNSRAFKWSGLPRGKDIWVRVRARNTAGPGAWSDPATIMVT